MTGWRCEQGPPIEDDEEDYDEEEQPLSEDIDEEEDGEAGPSAAGGSRAGVPLLLPLGMLPSQRDVCLLLMLCHHAVVVMAGPCGGCGSEDA